MGMAMTYVLSSTLSTLLSELHINLLNKVKASPVIFNSKFSLVDWKYRRKRRSINEYKISFFWYKIKSSKTKRTEFMGKSRRKTTWLELGWCHESFTKNCKFRFDCLLFYTFFEYLNHVQIFLSFILFNTIYNYNS